MVSTSVLREIGFSDNEIKIYLFLLKKGSSSAYSIAKETGIYRVHVYDKVEQLMDKGVVTQVRKGAKKYFQAAHPRKIKDYIDEKKREVKEQEERVDELLPLLEKMRLLPKEDTFVEVFKGKEGLKYFLKDIVKTKKPVCITDIDDAKFHETIPIFMQQYFRDMRKYKIKERVIALKKKKPFLFDKKVAPYTEYRTLEGKEFNPTNTFIYGDKVVLVTWGTPITAVMIKNKNLAETYRGQFTHLWKIAGSCG